MDQQEPLDLSKSLASEESPNFSRKRRGENELDVPLDLRMKRTRINDNIFNNDSSFYNSNLATLGPLPDLVPVESRYSNDRLNYQHGSGTEYYDAKNFGLNFKSDNLSINSQKYSEISQPIGNGKSKYDLPTNSVYTQFDSRISENISKTKYKPEIFAAERFNTQYLRDSDGRFKKASIHSSSTNSLSYPCFQSSEIVTTTHSVISCINKVSLSTGQYYSPTKPGENFHRSEFSQIRSITHTSKNSYSGNVDMSKMPPLLSISDVLNNKSSGPVFGNFEQINNFIGDQQNKKNYSANLMPMHVSPSYNKELGHEENSKTNAHCGKLSGVSQNFDAQQLSRSSKRTLNNSASFSMGLHNRMKKCFSDMSFESTTSTHEKNWSIYESNGNDKLYIQTSVSSSCLSIPIVKHHSSHSFNHSDQLVRKLQQSQAWSQASKYVSMSGKNKGVPPVSYSLSMSQQIEGNQFFTANSGHAVKEKATKDNGAIITDSNNSYDNNGYTENSQVVSSPKFNDWCQGGSFMSPYNSKADYCNNKQLSNSNCSDFIKNKGKSSSVCELALPNLQNKMSNSMISSYTNNDFAINCGEPRFHWSSDRACSSNLPSKLSKKREFSSENNLPSQLQRDLVLENQSAVSIISKPVVVTAMQTFSQSTSSHTVVDPLLQCTSTNTIMQPLSQNSSAITILEPFSRSTSACAIMQPMSLSATTTVTAMEPMSQCPAAPTATIARQTVQNNMPVVCTVPHSFIKTYDRDKSLNEIDAVVKISQFPHDMVETLSIANVANISLPNASIASSLAKEESLSAVKEEKLLKLTDSMPISNESSSIDCANLHKAEKISLFDSKNILAGCPQIGINSVKFPIASQINHNQMLAETTEVVGDTVSLNQQKPCNALPVYTRDPVSPMSVVCSTTGSFSPECISMVSFSPVCTITGCTSSSCIITSSFPVCTIMGSSSSSVSTTTGSSSVVCAISDSSSVCTISDRTSSVCAITGSSSPVHATSSSSPVCTDTGSSSSIQVCTFTDVSGSNNLNSSEPDTVSGNFTLLNVSVKCNKMKHIKASKEKNKCLKVRNTNKYQSDAVRASKVLSEVKTRALRGSVNMTSNGAGEVVLAKTVASEAKTQKKSMKKLFKSDEQLTCDNIMKKEAFVDLGMKVTKKNTDSNITVKKKDETHEQQKTKLSLSNTKTLHQDKQPLKSSEENISNSRNKSQNLNLEDISCSRSAEDKKSKEIKDKSNGLIAVQTAKIKASCKKSEAGSVELKHQKPSSKCVSTSAKKKLEFGSLILNSGKHKKSSYFRDKEATSSVSELIFILNVY